MYTKRKRSQWLKWVSTAYPALWWSEFERRTVKQSSEKSGGQVL